MRGILFKPEMRAAVAAGTKTQTRRLGGLDEINKSPDRWRIGAFDSGTVRFDGIATVRTATAKYRVGETVFIKEPYMIDGQGMKHYDRGRSFEVYPRGQKPKWKNAMFMPESASRYKIQITGVRCERLQEISRDDAIAEGLSFQNHCWRDEWIELWNGINKAMPWSFNPWIFCYEFKLL